VPDVLDFSVTRLSAVTVSLPRWRVEGRIVDTSDQTRVLKDFTGANAVTFPSVLGNLTQAQQDEWVERIVHELILRRFGII
jgi:hypothetical protein